MGDERDLGVLGVPLSDLDFLGEGVGVCVGIGDEERFNVGSTSRISDCLIRGKMIRWMRAREIFAVEGRVRARVVRNNK